MDFDLRRLLGSEVGRPAWVLASGASLLAVPMTERAEMHRGVVLGANDAVLLHQQLEGFPKLREWFVLDIGTFERLDPRCFAGVRVWTDFQCGCHLSGLGLRQGQDYETFRVGSSWDSKPDSGSLNSGRSSITPAIHAAWLMGCDPIHVRGVDGRTDGAGRNYFSDAPSKYEPNVERYGHQRDFLHAFVQNIRRSGVKIDVQSASWMAETPHVPFWERAPQVGALVGELK